MRLAPNRVPDADGLYLVNRSGAPVEEGGDVREARVGADPLDPPGRPEAALEFPGCPACRALPSLEAELVGWFVTQSLADGDGRRRLYAAGGLCGDRHHDRPDRALRGRRPTSAKVRQPHGAAGARRPDWRRYNAAVASPPFGGLACGDGSRRGRSPAETPSLG